MEEMQGVSLLRHAKQGRADDEEQGDQRPRGEIGGVDRVRPTSRRVRSALRSPSEVVRKEHSEHAEILRSDGRMSRLRRRRRAR